MSSYTEAIEEINSYVASFDNRRSKVRLPETERIFFVDEAQHETARAMGSTFWMPLERANATFVCSYIALFGIAPFTDEALARQPDRFSHKRLPLTIRNTSSFVLDAFGYDRRTGRERKVLYSPTPAISSNHNENRGKKRITDPAMAYFGANLIRISERSVEATKEMREAHHNYLATFFRNAGYAFPNRSEAGPFIERVDSLLASDSHIDLWKNGLHSRKVLETNLSATDITAALPPRTSHLFRQAIQRIKEKSDET
jgi:hypothetical protein